ncbi:hypothetical protein nbrc107696_33730 [Gordonia spumicola]|uniref:Uncharacterized protein n=1 Tax=Gordonia spumicola TaxID=589161 RepID=A0A7I9VCA0_9ACTN|nr:hypothetical protein [Gordonia spumicola]GEE02927.1 hypothetical protein nbrc107696_33730 [Gordonia spumicola]
MTGAAATLEALEVLLELAVSPVYFRSMFTDTPVTGEYIDDVAGRTVRVFHPLR